MVLFRGEFGPSRGNNRHMDGILLEKSVNTELSIIAPRFRAWVEEYQRALPPRIDRKVVHKHREENVFVSRFEVIDDEHRDDFIAQLYIDRTHGFFFEHPLDHVPGMMLIEAGRQLGITVAHLAYEVPMEDTVFILNGMEVDFSSYAELEVPVFVNSSVREKKFKRGVLTEMYYQGNFVQNEKSIGQMAGRLQIFPRKVMQRMRRNAGHCA